MLILSSLAGAARELGGALQVNPHDTRGMALAIQVALTMPLTERLERHAANLAVLKRNDIHAWHERMIGALAATARTEPRAPPAETLVRAAAGSGVGEHGDATEGPASRAARLEPGAESPARIRDAAAPIA